MQETSLKKDIPGIEGGSIHAEVTKKGDKYTVKASGEATPKIPGINSKLTVSYDDGMFDATVHAAYEKGMLKGSVTVGATNRPVGEDGKPAAEPPSGKADKITIYGDGSATLSSLLGCKPRRALSSRLMARLKSPARSKCLKQLTFSTRKSLRRTSSISVFLSRFFPGSP